MAPNEQAGRGGAIDLAGYVALVTGGNGGIGLGMAHGLASAGADVVIWGRDEPKNEAAAEALRSHGGQVLAQVCDVADEAAVDGRFADAVAALGKVDAVFANAGIGNRPALPWDISLDEWRRVMAVDLDGVFLTFRAGARHLVERGEGGALVAVGSTSAIHGAPMTMPYATAKTGVMGMVRAFAVALGRHRVRVNAVLPGWTDTDMLAGGKTFEKFVRNTTGRTPLGRWADPAELGPVAAFLADPRIEFHTGDSLVVDGGYTIF